MIHWLLQPFTVLLLFLSAVHSFSLQKNSSSRNAGFITIPKSRFNYETTRTTTTIGSAVSSSVGGDREGKGEKNSIPYGDGSVKKKNSQHDNKRYCEMPWSEFQEWALKDNLPQYMIHIDDTNDEKEGLSFLSLFLWRTMLRDVPELAGYEISFLRKMYPTVVKKYYKKSNIPQSPPVLLPYLDQFHFEKEGGLTGRIYDLPGIADGSEIQTPPLSNIHVTLPKGYVVSGKIVYELGYPTGSEKMIDSFSRSHILRTLAETQKNLSLMSKSVASTTNSNSLLNQNENDADLIMLRNVGGATAILLAGATAVNLLSHHLTVNVFWV